jgi:hypothetical protein
MADQQNLHHLKKFSPDRGPLVIMNRNPEDYFYKFQELHFYPGSPAVLTFSRPGPKIFL